MEFKKDDSCSIQKSSSLLKSPFFTLSTFVGTVQKERGLKKKLPNSWQLSVIFISYLNFTSSIFVSPAIASPVAFSSPANSSIFDIITGVITVFALAFKNS